MSRFRKLLAELGAEAGLDAKPRDGSLRPAAQLDQRLKCIGESGEIPRGRLLVDCRIAYFLGAPALVATGER
jgi:hypothetical protein